MVRPFAVPLFVVILSLTFGATPAAADGAVAIGVTDDIGSDGYSIGISFNAPNEGVAQRAAMARCRTTGSGVTRERCTLVQTFRNQCVAEANDPALGKPGLGWAIAPTIEAAKDQAMDKCIATAGEDRRLFCKLVQYMCDDGR